LGNPLKLYRFRRLRRRVWPVVLLGHFATCLSLLVSELDPNALPGWLDHQHQASLAEKAC